MNRLTSAKLYVDQQNEHKSDRFNEEVSQPSLRSGKVTLSQTNLAPLQKKPSQADVQSYTYKSRASRQSRVTVQSAFSKRSAAPSQQELIKPVPVEVEKTSEPEDNRKRILNLVNQLDDQELAKVSELLSQQNADN